MKNNTKIKSRARPKTKVKFGNRVLSTKLLIFIGLFAAVGAIFIVKSFASSTLILASQNLDSANSVNAVVIKDTTSTNKSNTNVVQLANPSGVTNSRATLVNLQTALDSGVYKACLLSRSTTGTITGSLRITNYVNLKPGTIILGKASFSAPKSTDYKETLCVSFTNATPNALVSAVIHNTTAGGTMQIGNVSLERTGDIPPSLLRPDSRGFAPYAYVPWGDVSMTTVMNAAGIKNFTAAFVLNNGSCVPAWDGNSTLGLSSSRSNIIKTDINNIRAAGGDVTVSFGGAGGTELALACSNVSALKAAYKSVIDTYGLTRVDFDIEGTAIANTAANDLRAQALVALQQEYPNLKVFVTLSVNDNGIPTNGVNFLVQLKNYGVYLAGINIMTMDYGVNSTQMGQLAIKSANSTFSQIKLIYGYADDLTWKTLNLTPMTGINDTKPETFSLANANELRTFADQKKIGALSSWSINRDKSCPNNAAILADTCSGVVQSPYQFSGILNMPPN